MPFTPNTPRTPGMDELAADFVWNQNEIDTAQQWQDELNDWFKGLETILKDGKYYSETRVYPIAAEDFNAAFGTNLKY